MNAAHIDSGAWSPTIRCELSLLLFGIGWPNLSVPSSPVAICSQVLPLGYDPTMPLVYASSSRCAKQSVTGKALCAPSTANQASFIHIMLALKQRTITNMLLHWRQRVLLLSDPAGKTKDEFESDCLRLVNTEPPRCQMH
eukprot:635834-Amphidinium_carterae.1